MTLSEAIFELEQAKAAYGDLDLVAWREGKLCNVELVYNLRTKPLLRQSEAVIIVETREERK